MSVDRLAYIKQFSQAAIDSTLGTSIFPSVKMAQAILESNNGNSVLAAQYGNHFGIKKGTGWNGPVVNMNTREVVNGKNVTVNQPFRKYTSGAESFKDHTNFLLNNSRYKANGVFAAVTPEQQLQALQKAGYATDPNYASVLTQIINAYGLKSLDEKKKKQQGPAPLS